MKKLSDSLIQVYPFSIHPKLKVLKNRKSHFRNPFSMEERERLVRLFEEKGKVHVFNGYSIRLDAIRNEEDVTIMEISEVEFFDFLTTTMIYNQSEAFLRYCEEHGRPREKDLIDRLCRDVEQTGGKPSFEKIIGSSVLSNIIAVSILIEDKHGNVGLVHRSKNVAISTGLFSVTATGSVDEQDFGADHPLVSCAIRELKEELNLNLGTDEMVLDEIVMSKYKLQPIALFRCRLDRSWEELTGDLFAAKDFHVETQEFYSVPVPVLAQFLYSETFTDAAAYQMFNRIVAEGARVDERKRDFDKRQYLLQP